MHTIKFTSNLKRFYPELIPVQVEGESILEILKKVNEKHPGIIDYILDEQQRIRKHVNIFVGENVISDKENLSNPIGQNAQIYVMQALSGG